MAVRVIESSRIYNISRIPNVQKVGKIDNTDQDTHSFQECIKENIEKNLDQGTDEGGNADQFDRRRLLPYSELEENGIIDYNGIIFICDYEENRLCLGDVDEPEDCLEISLSGGGCLVVNRDNIEELADAIRMFLPEDIDRIMIVIAEDKIVL